MHYADGDLMYDYENPVDPVDGDDAGEQCVDHDDHGEQSSNEGGQILNAGEQSLNSGEQGAQPTESRSRGSKRQKARQN